jgi:hypothetical protein
MAGGSKQPKEFGHLGLGAHIAHFLKKFKNGDLKFQNIQEKNPS